MEARGNTTSYSPMDLMKFPLPPPLHFLILLIISLTHFGSTDATSYNSLVYKNCTNQTYQGSMEIYSQVLSSVFHELASQSPRSNFSKTNKGNSTFGISALYQCRGDLRGDECSNCISKLAETPDAWCEGPAMAGRVQLSGCYFHFETDEFTSIKEERDDQVTRNYAVLQRICDGDGAVPAGFEGARDAALLQVETELAGSNSNGFYEGDIGYVHVMGQCEAGLGACECGECASLAVQVIYEECRSSSSAQVYLNQCFLSYKYQMPSSSSREEGDSASNTGRTVAIVIGGGAALFAIYMFLKYVKTRTKN